MNYISDQAGIFNRYALELENWSSHLEKTKQYICDYVLKNNFNTVSVLGSGWLLDLPVDFLSYNLKKILLYDVFHPPQIRHKFKKNNRFELITADITGGLIAKAYQAAHLYKKSKRKTRITELEFTGFKPVEETDCYISLNILNQLDLLIIDFLKKTRIYTEKELKKLRTLIQESHLKELPKNKSCLITDIEELRYRKEDAPVISKNLLYAPLPEGKNIQTWDWLFDTKGTYNKGYKTAFKVIAMEI
ncbi:MAG TPA: hypothetical protein VJ346_02155 [Bacteroidales bacterium]|nr:hypothetical protein [Bacteroidales bacterium]